MKKIIISGFSHTGTTILRAVIGHCKSVYEVREECSHITPEMEQEAKEGGYSTIVIKTTEFTRAKDYPDYHRILLIRDPRFVFSSILRRKGEIPPKRSFFEYKRRLNQWLRVGDNEKTYCLRYEDLFKSDFKAIKSLLRFIKIRYTKKVFDNSEWVNKTGDVDSVPIAKPEEENHGEFRTWQINQPLRNMNDPEKIDLPERTLAAIEKSELVKKAGY